MKNILFITRESLADPKRGTPIRIYNIARQLSKRNRVTLLSPGFDNGFEVNYYKYPLNKSLFYKIFYFLNLIRKNNIDIVFTSTEIMILEPFIIKFIIGIKIVIDLHGHHAKEMYYQKLIGPVKKDILEIRNNFILKFYDLLLVCSDNNDEYYKKIHKKTKLLYDGLDTSKFKTTKKTKPEIFTIGYAGNLKDYQGVNFLLDACANLKKKNLFPFRIKLVISSGSSNIDEMLEVRGLQDVTEVTHKVPQEEANRIMSTVSVLIVPRPNLPVTYYGFPSKLPKDLMTGIPTITTDVGPVKVLFGDCDCCLIIGHDNITLDLESAIKKVFNMSEDERNKMGERAIKFVTEKLDWNVLGDELNDFIEQV